MSVCDGTRNLVMCKTDDVMVVVKEESEENKSSVDGQGRKRMKWEHKELECEKRILLGSNLLTPIINFLFNNNSQGALDGKPIREKCESFALNLD